MSAEAIFKRCASRRHEAYVLEGEACPLCQVERPGALSAQPRARGLSLEEVRRRLRSRWTVSQALTTPPGREDA